jgi:glucose/arabinose dehydrogenase
MKDRDKQRVWVGVVSAGIVVCFGAWASTLTAQEQPPLKTYRISASDLPEPGTSASNGPKVVPKPANAALTVPPGFRIDVFADGFKRPRWAVQAPNGDVFVSDSTAGSIFVLRDANRNHVIEESERREFASGLKQPFGMAFWKDRFYVANTDAVMRFRYKRGQLKAVDAPEKIADLPSGPSGHWTRTIRFAPNNESFYVTVGSSSNVDVEKDPLRATVLRFKPDGSGREVIATGVRNAIGFDFHPQTKEPWMAVQERDGLGDELVPDFVTRLRQGAFYGWPYAYTGQREEPRRKGERSDLVKTAVMPEVLIQAHSAIMGLVFYNGKLFPAKYRTGAFGALRGSSNRSKRTGYKVVFLPFTKGQPDGGYEDFAIGWMLREDSPEVWGRPVGLAVLKDGSLIVTDDAAGKIWRVSYSGATTPKSQTDASD